MKLTFQFLILSNIVSLKVSMGSFLSSDPQHVNHNPFSYCHHSPLSFVDKTGERPIYLTDDKTANHFLPGEMDVNNIFVKPHESIDETLARVLSEEPMIFKHWNGHLDLQFHGAEDRNFLEQFFGLHKSATVYMQMNEESISAREMGRAVKSIEYYSMKMKGSKLKSININSCFFSRPSNSEFQNFIDELHEPEIFEFKRNKLTKKLLSRTKFDGVFIENVEVAGNLSLLRSASILNGFVRNIAKTEHQNIRAFKSNANYFHPFAIPVGEPIGAFRNQIPDFHLRYHTRVVNALDRYPLLSE